MKMKSLRHITAKSLSLLALTFALTATSPVRAGGGNAGNPGILPPHSHAFGHTYGEWSAKWWQWALSLPAAGHPLIDGTDCSIGQTGKVWFLGGSFASNTAVRTCTVPAGTALFFPILNTIFAETGSDTDEIALAAVHGNIDQVLSAALKVVGKAARNLIACYRTDSPFFDVSLPPTGGLFGPDFDGAVLRSVADGIYVMLAPLSVGQHTIHFTGASSADGGFTLDVTYHITVAPRR